MKTVLFLCTGNYYRSRFAESLFNTLAAQQKLSWQADSRGLALERGVNNVGAISKYAVAGLVERGVIMDSDLRYPLPVTEADLAAADRIVAIDESEHRSLLIERFPKWADAVEYWLVHDVGETLPLEALSAIEQHVQQLIHQVGLQ